MCVICKDWQAGKLTSKEALRNIGEVINSESREARKHLFELSEKILDKEVPFDDADDELDQKWHDETHD